MKFYVQFQKGPGVPGIHITCPNIIKIGQVTLELSLRTRVVGAIWGVITPLRGVILNFFPQFQKGPGVPGINTSESIAR